MKHIQPLDTFLKHMTNSKQYHELQSVLTGKVIKASQSPLRLSLRFVYQHLEAISKLKTFKYRYTPELEAFAECLMATPMPCASHYLETVCHHPAIPLNHCVELEQMRAWFSTFLNALYERLNSPALKQLQNAHQKQMNRSRKSLCRYVDVLFKKYARLLAVRVDFSYTEDVELAQLESDLLAFYESSRHNPLFDDMAGYVLKIEHGLDKGLHVHALLFFDGAKRKGSSHIAQEIGKHWACGIVGAYGFYWNCHADKANYERLKRLGIGDIRYTDTELIANLKRYILQYFCKRQQYIKPIAKPKMRLIRRGDLPRISNKGAPRKYKQ